MNSASALHAKEHERSAAEVGGHGRGLLLSPRSERQPEQILLSPAPRALGCSKSLGSWGYASLHPRLYANTRFAGSRLLSRLHSGAPAVGDLFHLFARLADITRIIASPEGPTFSVPTTTASPSRMLMSVFSPVCS